MIAKVKLRNFKCFEEQDIHFGPLTLLSGLNGVGKSTIIQSLLLLRQSYLSGLLPNVGLALNGDFIQLGTAKDVFFEGASDNIFGFELAFSDNTKENWYFEYDRIADVVQRILSSENEEIYKTNLFSNRFHYLQAERIGPRTSFKMSDFLVRQQQQLGTRGEYTTHFLSLFGEKELELSDLLHPASVSSNLKSQVEAWLSEISPGVRIRITPYADMDIVNLQYEFSSGRTTTESFRATNVGFGITYTLPIIVALLSASPGILIILENPEAHLHPRGQVKIGELIARVANHNVQVIVETHSDHILNGIRVAVHSKLISPENIRIHFVEKDIQDEQVVSKLISPKLDISGRLDTWPDGFFDEWDKSLEKLLTPVNLQR